MRQVEYWSLFSYAGGKGRAAPKPLRGSTLSSFWRSVSAPVPLSAAGTRDHSHNAPAVVSIAVRGTQDQSRSVAVSAAVPATFPDTQDQRRRTVPAGAREIPRCVLRGVMSGAPGCIASRFPRCLINADGPFFASNIGFRR